MIKKILIGWGVTFCLLVSVGERSSGGEEQDYWSRFNPGSWVLYELPQGAKQKMTLISKTSAAITLRTEFIVNGSVLSRQDTTIPLGGSLQEEQLELHNKVKEYEDRVSVKGRSLVCKVWELDASEGITKVWFSEEVPGGIVQSSRGREMLMRVIDYQKR